MPISAADEQTPWTTRQAADATGVCLTRATRKIRKFDEQLAFVLRACRGLDPHARDCELAEMVTAILHTGGKLAAADRDMLRQHVRRRIEQIGEQADATGP